jgi:hypothetical protein
MNVQATSAGIVGIFLADDLFNLGASGDLQRLVQVGTDLFPRTGMLTGIWWIIGVWITIRSDFGLPKIWPASGHSQF